MSFLLCINASGKTEKAKPLKNHHSRKGPGHSVAPILGQLVPTNISHSHLDPEPVARKHPTIEEEPGVPSRQSRGHRCNCENDSKSATCSSTSNESHTSGYQTDDGTFEGKMLQHATRSKPANIRMTALKDYSPCCTEELVLRRGQRVKVLYKKNDWVYAVAKSGEAGYVPYNYVRPSRKYAGYQSEPEYAGETDFYQSGYETDMPVSGRRRYGSSTRTQVGDQVPAFSVHTGFRESPESYVPRSQVHGGNCSPPSSSHRTPHRHASGYTSAVECSTSPDFNRHHPRPARSQHSIVNAGDSPTDRRPSVGKPGMDTFTQQFLEELVVIHDFEAQEEDEVFISKGERVKVMNAEDPFWLWVETTAGMQGFVPRSCCSLGNHPSLQSTRRPSLGNVPSGRTRRYYHPNQRTKAQLVARQARSQAKQRFHELARQRKNSAQNPILMDKEEIQRVGSKLIVLMDYTATQNDELDIQFAETVYADVLKQAGAERIWTYCPRSEQCGYVPVSLLVPPVV